MSAPDPDAELRKSDFDSDLTQYRAFHQGIFEIAKGSIDRARAGAESVRTAAAAIGVIYAAIVGVAFSVDAPLPPRGVIPAIFLGLAIALATGYVAFLSPEMDEVPWPIEGVDYRTDQVARSEFIVEWIAKGVYQRSSALRASVLALAFAVAFLPAPFLKLEASAISDAASSELPAWPPVPKGNSETDRILYQAQVAEVAEQRKAAQEEPRPGESLSDPLVLLVWVAFLVGLFVIWVTWTDSRPTWSRKRPAGQHH